MHTGHSPQEGCNDGQCEMSYAQTHCQNADSTLLKAHGAGRGDCSSLWCHRSLHFIDDVVALAWTNLSFAVSEVALRATKKVRLYAAMTQTEMQRRQSCKQKMLIPQIP
jgi:hypothetical protein